MRLSLEKEYYLLLLDIKNSTAMPEARRGEVFGILERQLTALNHTFATELLFKIEINYGDEVAILMSSPADFYVMISTLREALFPHAQFRFVVTHGKIGMIADDIRAVGGEIFKKADAQVKQLKRKDRFCSWQLQETRQGAVLTSLCEMGNALLQRMTSYQRETYQYLNAGMTQKEIAAKLKKYPQSVSNAIKSSSAETVISANRVIHDILKNY